MTYRGQACQVDLQQIVATALRKDELGGDLVKNQQT
jgi:hypothetical protein